MAAEESTDAAPAELDEVTVVLGGRQVLGPLSLTLGRREHWALLGPNGAGKTTLLSLLGAQRHPTTGRARVLGGQLGRVDLRELRRHIGVVGHLVADRLPAQVSALEIVLTGRDGLLAPWWSEFDDEERAAAGALLERLHCGHLAAQPFGRCSQGERQRVLIARSLFGRHELLLLDEPALGVDLPGREALVQALDQLAVAPGAPASIQVAHTLEELPRSITHALLLRAGSAVASGPVDAVLTDEALSECYGLEFHVTRPGGRFSAHAAGSW
ncbi:MAG TPA: ATP-binding cassette domain-containing protein [Acidimicrobiales bacterium]|nr:ATP-binding cassette domain-containing protein [Acidimicrobiales bacterium]